MNKRKFPTNGEARDAKLIAESFQLLVFVFSIFKDCKTTKTDKD